MRQRLIGSLAAIAFIHPADAAVLQSVLVEYTLPGQPIVQDGDLIEVPNDQPVPTELLATLPAPPSGSFLLSASAGRFGEVGIEGGSTMGGSFASRVEITVDELVNDTGITRNAVSRFIVDGGTIRLLGTAGSTASIGLSVTALVDGLQRDQFFASLEIEQIESFGASVINTEGDALPFTVSGTGVTEVALPPFLGELDIGPVSPGSEIELFYIAGGFMELTGPPEIASVSFSDPLSISFAPRSFADLDAGAPAAEVPLPPSGLVLLAGLALLGLRLR